MENEARDYKDCAKLSEARLVYWAKLPGWRLREASALLLELDPDDLDVQKQSSFRDLQRVLLRARSMKALYSPIKPRRFLEWAVSNQIEIPSHLQSEVCGQTELADWRKKALRRGRRLARMKSQQPQLDINARSKQTAERFFLCMAFKWYRIGTSLNFNFKAMLSDVTINGKEKISDGTIRSWIAEAKERQSEILDEMMESLDVK